MPWQPLNKYCWDFWFIEKEGKLHVFFLQANRWSCAYNPDRRHNLASVGHAILTPFGWQEIAPEKLALAKREGDFWDDISIWTGSIIEYENSYYMLYTSRRSQDEYIITSHERRQPQNIGIAESIDLINWQRTVGSKEKPTIPNPGFASNLDGVSWRDPYVIRDDVDKQFYAFICACPKDAPTDAGGVVAYVTSPDLENWQTSAQQVLYKSPEFRYLEVPSVFWRRNRDRNHWLLYLIFSPYWNRFFERCEAKGTYYVRSQPIVDRNSISYDRIVWQDSSAILLVEGLYGGKFVNPSSQEYPGFFGFPLEDEAGHFIGGISDPQWAIFDEDGKIHLTYSQM